MIEAPKVFSISSHGIFFLINKSKTILFRTLTEVLRVIYRDVKISVFQVKTWDFYPLICREWTRSSRRSINKAQHVEQKRTQRVKPKAVVTMFLLSGRFLNKPNIKCENYKLNNGQMAIEAIIFRLKEVFWITVKFLLGGSHILK